MGRTVVLLTTGALAVLLASVAVLTLVVAVPEEAGAAVPGKNGRIAFVRVPDVNDYRPGAPHIYTMHPDGTDVQQFTDSPGIEDSPAWSPDGSKIAFRTEVWDIVVKGFPNGTPNTLFSDDNINQNPEWSPNGSKIAFSSENTRSFGIWVMNSSDGSGLRQLVPVGGNPAWSPDGLKIAFVTASSSISEPSISTVKPDGTGHELLVPECYCQDPDYSPDGSKVVFGRLGDIWVVHADGTHLKNLTNTSAAEVNPAFSPNGRKIIYSKRTINPSQRGTTANLDWNIWKMHADGTHRKNVTNTPLYDEYQPDWQPVP